MHIRACSGFAIYNVVDIRWIVKISMKYLEMTTVGEMLPIFRYKNLQIRIRDTAQQQQSITTVRELKWPDPALTLRDIKRRDCYFHFFPF